jgi:hypothetical protein
MNAARQLKPFRGARVNRTHPLARGLVGCWIFNEGTGNMVYDLSGYGNHGTLTNMDPATDWVGGKHGWALDLDGSNDAISIQGSVAYISLIDRTSTIEIWMKLATTSQDSVIAGQFSGDTIYKNSYGTGFRYDNGDVVLMSESDNNKSALTVALTDTSAWHHLAGIVRTTQGKLYLDGELVDSGDLNGGYVYPFNIGAGLYLGNLLNYSGFMGLVRVWHSALSAEEVAWLYREPYCMFEEPAPRSIFIMPGILPIMLQHDHFDGGAIL